MKSERLRRFRSKELDKILGEKINVLDQGFIRVVDYMGGDESIVQAARVSYGKGTKKIHQDIGLIRYLMRHRHTTPFEMCEIKFHVKVPMDTWRQWIRHRTANVNEYSTRYSEAIDASQKTEPTEWRAQSKRNKQGSGQYIDSSKGEILSKSESDLLDNSREIYEKRLEMGVAREQARKDLPLSTYTEAYWKIDLHNLFHFLALRMDSHAQYEIRSYAKLIGEKVVSVWCPIAWEAFQDYKLNTLNIFKHDQKILEMLINKRNDEALSYGKKIGWVLYDKNNEIKKKQGKTRV